MGRREARIDRKLRKRVQQDGKRARLIASVSPDHSPRRTVSVPEKTGPRATENPDSIMQMRMDYAIFASADREGEWSWGQHRNWCSPDNSDENACSVRAAMIQMSGLYWHEIHSQTTGGKDRHHKHHSQELESICEEAQARWKEIEREEDELFRFRIAGKQRIWGYREGHVFNVVWWDPEHQIYPVD